MKPMKPDASVHHKAFVQSAARRSPSLRAALGWVALFVIGWMAACDDSVQPAPPKQENLAPETYLTTVGDTLAPQLYRLRLSWLGSDADGKVVSYRRHWTCPPGMTNCLPDTEWVTTTAVSEQFFLPVPTGTARYVFEVAAVDQQGAADASPARQTFDLYNTPPDVQFESGTLPTQTLAAVTFYMIAVDPDTTADDGDNDTGDYLDHYEAWLDGEEGNVKVFPVTGNSVSLRVEDFGGRYGPRTVFVQVVDEAGTTSSTIQHTWQVDAAPEDGILLVDDCTQTYSVRSDQSYRTVLEAQAPGQYVVLEIRKLPRLNQGDLEANLALLDKVVWYTDADATSSGALELARQGLLELLEARHGKLFLSSSLVFGTGSALGDKERRFRDLCGIDSVFAWPDGVTDFEWNQVDSVRAAVPTSTLRAMRFLSIGHTMECFQTRADGTTRSLYFYPESTFVREREIGGIPTQIVNPVQFDIGLSRDLPDGGHVAYVSFPIGLPVNSNAGESEIELREVLRTVGILSP